MLRAQSGMVATLIVVLVAAVGQTSHATVLTFDMSPYPGFIIGGFESTYASYGDNVAATSMPGPGVTYDYGQGNGFTPNITLDYSHSAAPMASGGHTLSGTQGGWSDPADYLHFQDTTQFWFTFTPDDDYGVDVNSFAIDLFGGAVGTLNWRLRQDNIAGAVFASGSQSSLLTSDPDRIINIANGSYYGTVVLEVDFTGTGNVGNVGLDDLNFDQLAPVPPIAEPASGLLLGLACCGSLMARRRKASRDERRSL